MDERVVKLKTLRDCEIFAENAIERNWPDLAREARIRGVELRAQSHGAKTQAEKECLQAVYAYEEVLAVKNGKRTKASRTSQMIERNGILGAVERAVNRKTETVGYTALLEMGYKTTLLRL